MAKIVNRTEFLKNKLYKIYKKTLAFTLAETLIVMGVIGVVAALTLPNLNQSTGNKEKVAKVKKIYQNLNDAYGRAVVVYGPFREWCNNLNAAQCDKRTMERVTEFMKVSKDCGNGSGCMPSSIKTLNGNSGGGYDGGDTNVYTCVLADGTGLAFDEIGFVEADIDGIKGSNTWGKDLFTFVFNPDGVDPEGFNHTDSQLKNGCFKTGGSCTGWVVQSDNMDYLKCPNDLSWTNITCK